MSSYTLSVSRGATATGNQRNTLYSYIDWKITSLTYSVQSTLTAQQIYDGDTTNVYVEISVGETVYNTNIIELDSTAREDKTFQINIDVPAYSSVSFVLKGVNSTGFYANQNAIYAAEGVGNSGNWNDMVIVLSYDDIWVIDDKNGGYPHDIQYGEYDWIGYPVDENNVPFNVGVWRITNLNDGYPYITLPAETKKWILNEYLRLNGENIQLQRYLKQTINDVVVYTPVQAYYKEYIPI